MESLLCGLLQKSPESRLSVEEAVNHYAVAPALYPEWIENPETKQKRLRGH